MAEKTNIERRFIPFDNCEMRADDDGKPVISGYAAIFNEFGNDSFGFKEKIAPGAFTNTIKDDDIRSLFNHDANHVLGRQSAGTLRLKEDKKGLFQETDINTADPDAMSVFEKIRRSDVTGQSFSFEAVREEWFEPEEGLPERTLLEVNVIDVGPVTFPFYESTDVNVALRSLDKFRGENKDAQIPKVKDHKTKSEIEKFIEKHETLLRNIEKLDKRMNEIENKINGIPSEPSPDGKRDVDSAVNPEPSPESTEETETKKPKRDSGARKNKIRKRLTSLRIARLKIKEVKK